MTPSAQAATMTLKLPDDFDKYLERQTWADMALDAPATNEKPSIAGHWM
jgi:hypothetical protein